MAGTDTLGSAADTKPVGAQREAEARGAARRGFEEPKRARSWKRDSVVDAVVAGLLAGALGLFFLGLTTETGRNIVPINLNFLSWLGLTEEGPSGQLRVGVRWLDMPEGFGKASLLLVVALIVFAGRLVLNLLFFKNPKPAKAKAASGRVSAGTVSLVSKFIGVVFFLFAASLPFLLFFIFPNYSREYISLAILILTYVMLGWGLNIVVGLAGLLDLGYVAFYAVGAYSFALLAHNFGLGFWLCLPLAGILAAFWGLILGFPVLRLRGDYLAIVTLAFGEIIRVVIINWYDFTGGPNGLLGIPKPSFFGLEFERGEDGFAAYFGLEFSTVHRFIWLYYIIFGLALLTNFVTLRLRRLPIGRAWEALREDEIACRSLGINTTNTKLTAFAIGAMFGGIAGSFFATRQGHISPESFVFAESAIILAIVVLGGLGSQIGVVLAAIVLIGGPELLRNLDFLKQIFGEDFDPVRYRLLIFGLVMVAIMVWRPRGLISSRSPSAVLREKKRIGADLVAQGEGH